MSDRKSAAIVLAAGEGSRMKSSRPKALHEVAGRAMVCHVLDRLAEIAPDRRVVVVGTDAGPVGEAVAPTPTVVQDRPLGTAHAVLAARAYLTGFDGDVLIVYGDTPLITARTMTRMLAALRAPAGPAVVVLGFRPADPAGYGRLIVAADGALQAIVEDREATEAQRAIGLCNAGIMAVDGRRLLPLLDAVDDDNAKGEYYLSDIVGLARARGHGRAVCVAEDAEEVMGVNTRADLAAAEAVVQRRLRARAMAGGATLLDPDSVHFSHDTVLGRDARVGPQVFFGPGVTVGDRVEIRAFCHLEGAAVADDAVVGPFARLRPGARIGPEARIGNFVEIKEAILEHGAKVNHLSYVGDARIGAKANVGAGTITCNYDGFLKSRTEIGAGALIGSNNSLVAPVAVGAGAITGAGSVITRDVPADALAVERVGQTVKDGWAEGFRARRRVEKRTKRPEEG